MCNPEEFVAQLEQIIGPENEAHLMFELVVSNHEKTITVPILAKNRGDVIHQVLLLLLCYREGMSQIQLEKQGDPYVIDASIPGENLQITIHELT